MGCKAEELYRWALDLALYFVLDVKNGGSYSFFKYQITIPRDMRRALGLKAGDKLLVVVLDDSMIVLKKPKSFAGAIKGMGKGLYPADYLKKERESWE